MSTRLFCLVLLVFTTGIVFGQKPTAKPGVSELKKIIAGIGLPYRMVNDSLAVIPYGGKNIESYDVIVQKISDLYIVYTNLSEALPGKIDSSKFKYLLQQNDHFDVIKIGMSSDENSVYVRADVYKSGTNTVLLKRVITQVANVANILAGDLK